MHLYSTLLPQAAGRQQTDCAGAHHGNLTPPRISPSCPHCLLPVSPGAVAGQEYHYQIADEGRTGSKPAAMRNSPPQAALWTDGHRSAPSLAIFDAVSRTGGLGASSSVASTLLPEGLSSADVSRCRIFTFQGKVGSNRLPILPIQGKLWQDALHDLKIISRQGFTNLHQ